MRELLTIFTPTYNRAYTLERLYQSLLQQTDKNFVWMVVNDGSEDNTGELFQKWIAEDKIEIQYYEQPNQGKSAALNRGIEMADTELFACVDSDDYLTEDAVQKIETDWEKHPQNIIGLLYFKQNWDQTPITKYSGKNTTDTVRGFYEGGLWGDAFMIYRLNIMKKYRFPQFPGEKFVPEAYFFDLLDQDGPILMTPQTIYIAEYLPDGYTAGMAKLLYQNPQGYFAYIKQRIQFDKTLKNKFWDSVRYDAMAIAHKVEHRIKNSSAPFLSVAAYPLGYVLFLKKYRNLR